MKEFAISQVSTSFSNFIKHIHPVKIPLKALELKTTWALGGLRFMLVMVLMGSGILMLLAYQPFPELAYSLGLLLVEEKKYDQAELYLQRAALGLPGRPRIHYNLGLLLQFLKKSNAAEKSLLRALSFKL